MKFVVASKYILNGLFSVAGILAFIVQNYRLLGHIVFDFSCVCYFNSLIVKRFCSGTL